MKEGKEVVTLIESLIILLTEMSEQIITELNKIPESRLIIRIILIILTTLERLNPTINQIPGHKIIRNRITKAITIIRAAITSLLETNRLILKSQSLLKRNLHSLLLDRHLVQADVALPLVNQELKDNHF